LNILGNPESLTRDVTWIILLDPFPPQ
jgi:hypothetical protein